jgi:3'(2'), 5'-bisphosphate nucleotidase
MQASEMRQLADGLLGVTLAAARVQMGYFAAGVAVERKADESPVTAADRQSEEIILEGLAKVAPGVPVIAEEAVTAGRIPAIGREFFLVDPLDGTKSFIKGRPSFTINIALVEDGRPTFGLLYAPAMADFYVTLAPTQAANAHLQAWESPRTLDETGPKAIRTRAPDPNALYALVSQTHLNRPTERFLDGYHVLERRALASSLKFGLMARGEADIYPRVGPTSQWDTAAGHALLVAAGGTVTKLDGAPLLYGDGERGFANPDFVAWGRGPLPRVREP